MRTLLTVLGTIALFNVISIQGNPVDKCIARNVTYKIADDEYCDKYHECTSKGVFIERDCRDGYDFSAKIEQCDFPFKVDCGDRKLRQQPQSQNPLCERLYGLYPFSPAESCAKFYHCQEGVAYEKECPYTSIYDPTVGTCVHPGAANRPDCSATQVFSFTCPNKDKKFAKLRFYDHDRLKHPEDCRQYFACFTDGQPRLLSCPYKTVFHEKTGRCIKFQKHPDPICKEYYLKGGKGYKVETDDDDSDIDEVAVESGEHSSDDSAPPVKSTQSASPKKSSSNKQKSRRQSTEESAPSSSSESHNASGSKTSGNKVDKGKHSHSSKKSDSKNKNSRASDDEDDEEDE